MPSSVSASGSRAFRATLIIKENEYAEQGGDENPKDGLIKCGASTDLMGLLVKEPQVKYQKKDNDYSKDSKKYCLLLGQVIEERKCEYVKHYVQMICTASEEPLASKNRILDFAEFQNYKYILNPKIPFSDF